MKFTQTAKILSEGVKPFTKREQIYEAEKPDVKFDEEVLMEYHQAITAMEMWMQIVLRLELDSSPNLGMTSCELRLPEGRIILDMPTEEIDCGGNGEECARDCHDSMRELIQTPIGQINRFAWFTIRGIEPNPVSLFYKHMGRQSRKLHELLEKRGITDPFVINEVLAEHGIQDPLMIHRCSNIWLGVENFLEAKMI